MNTHELETLGDIDLVTATGGLPAGAQWIMTHESHGDTSAGHLHSQGRGDGSRGNHSSAFGAFQMTEATRKRYMGSDYQSTNFDKQYSAATRYVDDRYGGWSQAQRFWQRHHWY